jgi:hypothetical protein
MRLYLTFLILIIGLLAGCRKECRYVDLPEIECSDNYNLVENVTLRYYYGGLGQSGLENYIINDDSTYTAQLGGSLGSKPFGEIDFSSKTLIGQLVRMGEGTGYMYQHFLCNNEAENIWKHTVKYSVEGQCQGGSGYTDLMGSFYIICDKIPSTGSVVFEAENVNPYTP